MARQLRIEFEGAYYHILLRGNNQSNIFHSDEDQQALIEKAARLLDCNIDFFRESKRLLGNSRDKRDAILYFLWKTGRCSNQKIGELFNITYSSVSRRVSHVKEQLKKVTIVRSRGFIKN